MKNKILLGSTMLAVLVSSLAWAAEDHSKMDHSAHMKTQATEERKAEIAKRGKDVMPFDLAATTHIFTKTSTGGTQKIVTKKSNDEVQVKLARQHLQEIRTKFLKGDFSGPIHIHGQDMPGLDALKTAKSGEIVIDYKNIKGGGQLIYKTKEKSLVTALHKWFDAQVSDHGKDAMAGHNN